MRKRWNTSPRVMSFVMSLCLVASSAQGLAPAITVHAAETSNVAVQAQADEDGVSGSAEETTDNDVQADVYGSSEEKSTEDTEAVSGQTTETEEVLETGDRNVNKATEADTKFDNLKKEIEANIPAGMAKVQYGNNYQSGEAEPFTYKSGTGTATVDAGLTMDVKSLTSNLFIATWDNTPFIQNGIVTTTFQYKSEGSRVGFILKSSEDFKGISVRYDVPSEDGKTATWVLQNEADGSYKTFTGPVLEQNKDYKLRIGFSGSKLLIAVDDTVIFDGDAAEVVSGDAAAARGQVGLFKWFNADASFKIKDFEVSGVGTKTKPVVEYIQNYEDASYTPNWSNKNVVVETTDTGNKVLKIPAGAGRIVDNDSPAIKEGTLSLKYKAVAPAGTEPKQFGFRFGVSSDKFRELNWDGGQWVVENQSGYPGIDMPKPISGTWNDLTINFKDGSATIWLNKEEVGTFTLDVLKDGAAGKFGIRTWGSTAVYLDDVHYTGANIEPEPLEKYENDFQDGITSSWTKGSPSIISEGENKILKLTGLNGVSELTDAKGVSLAQGTYLAKVKASSADLGLQFGKAIVSYKNNAWQVAYKGKTYSMTSESAANTLSPKVGAWNNIGIKIMENTVTLSINGKTATAVLDENVNEAGYLGVNAAGDVYLDDICFTEQFLDLSTAPASKMYYEEYYETVSSLNWKDLGQAEVKSGHLTGSIAAGKTATNSDITVPDNAVYQVKLQADQASAGIQFGNLAVYNTSDKEWAVKNTVTNVVKTIGTSDQVKANEDFVLRAELVKGILTLKVNGKTAGTADVSAEFDKTKGGYGIYNPNSKAVNVKVDALGAEEIQVYSENFGDTYTPNWTANVGMDSNNNVIHENGKLGVKITSPAKFLDMGSLRMKDFHASFDFTPSVGDTGDGGRYGFVFRGNDFKDGFSVEVDINGNWRVNVNDSSVAFDKIYSLKANNTYKVYADVVGTVVQLRFVEEDGTVVDMGSVTMNDLPDSAGHFGVRSWYTGKTLTFDNMEMTEEPSLPTFKLAEKTAEIKKGDLSVKMDTQFPRIISYSLKDKTMMGEENQIDTILINGRALTPKVTGKQVNGTTYEYTLDFAEQKLVMKATYMAADHNVVQFNITQIQENGDFKVKTVSLGENDWAYADDRMENASYAWEASNGQWHGINEELVNDMSTMKKSGIGGTTMAMVSGNGLAASIENNVMSGGNKVLIEKTAKSLVKKAQIRNGVWTYRHENSDSTEALPWAKIVITEDANEDQIVDWQDGAVAHRKYILTEAYGAKDMANNMMYIAFNFASQANDTFLNTLETGKVLYNYMDGFGQMILHKGYQAEGHDDDIPSYSNVGVRQGGAEDMKFLINEGAKYNLNIGVHLNATEYHLDANELYYNNLNGATAAGYKSDPLSKGWDWIDTSFYVDQTKDVLSGQLQKRLTDLYNLTKTGNNALDFYYIDVYTGNDYNAYKLAQYVNGLGMKIGTEFAGPIEPGVTFTHWGTDLGYPNKGNKSTLSRMVKNNLDIFVGNALYKGQKIPVVDTWGDSKTDVQQGVTVFYNEVLPTKYMQHFGVLKSETDKITFEDKVTSERNKTTGMIELRKDGKLISSWSDTGTTTDEGERHAGEALSLIPWNWDVDTGNAVGVNDGAKLYHWNPTGGESTWELTDAFKNVTAFDLYETTQQGKVKVTTIQNKNGSITIDAKKNTSYVLYPSASSHLVETAENWGEGSPVKDFAFNAEKFAEEGGIWEKTGDAKIEVVPGKENYDISKEMDLNRWNRYAQFKTEGGTLTQTMTGLVPGQDYTVGVWTEAQNGRKSELNVEINGENYTNYVTGKDGSHQSSFKYVNTNWQRMDVEFKVPEGVTEATITLKAEAGSGTVSYDDVKVWKHTTTEKDVNSSEYVMFEDFENTYEGWGPFEYGGGSRQIHIASDRSYENDNNEIVQPGEDKVGPVMTWVLDGENSLKINETAVGKHIVTNESNLKLPPNTTYDLSFDYTLEDGADFVVFVKPKSDSTSAKELAFTNLGGVKEAPLTHLKNTGDKKTKATFNGTFTTGAADDYQIFVYESKINQDKQPTQAYALILDNVGVKFNLAESKSLLQTTYNESKNLQEKDYFENSWNVFKTAQDAAKAALDNGAVTAAECRNAYDALKAAVDQLVPRDMEGLKALIKKAEALNSAIYSQASFAKVTAAVEAAKKVNESDAEAMAKAAKALDDSMKALVNIENAQRAVTAAKKVTNANYTAKSWNAFQSAITTVENLIKNATDQAILNAAAVKISSTQAGLAKAASESAVKKLSDLYNAYYGKDADYSQSTYSAIKSILSEMGVMLADKANITEAEVNDIIARMNALKGTLVNVANAKKAAAEAKTYNPASYTGSTWSVFQNALNEVNRLLSVDKGVTQSQLDGAVKKLTDAQKALRARANTIRLKSEYDKNTKLNLKKYTSVSGKKVKDALAKAKVVLNDTNASQATVDAAYKQLTGAVKGLVKNVVTSVKMNVTKKTLGVKEKLKLTVSAKPAGVTTGKITWKSSNKKAVTVNSKGQITAKGIGTATITATTSNKKKATCKIKVKAAPKSVRLTGKTLSVKVKKTLQLKAVLSKGSAGSVTYKTSNKKLATVNSNGKVTGVKKGTVKITVTTYNKKSYMVRIRVK